jgi:UDP-N-acetylmuramoylalanine--D-glutamate ligase
MYKNKKILILGMARSGYEAAKLLSQYDNFIIVTDMSEQDKEHVDYLESKGVKVVITKDPLYLLDNSFDYIVKNPGISFNHPLLKKAKKMGIKIINELEVAYYFLKDKVKIIGITGSNGKTTTTTLIYEVIKKSGLSVLVGGNIGFPLCSLVDKVKTGDILVLEIAGHQLYDMYDFKTDISILTNLYPVHLDFFLKYNVYKNTKIKIFNNHTSSDIAIYNKGNKDVVNSIKNINSKKISFSSSVKSDCYLKDDVILYNKEPIIDVKDLRIKGTHNYENIMCAIIVAKQLEIDNEVIKDTLLNFLGVEHRIEFVKKINDREVYNDSKSTNTESTIVALKSFSKNVMLLLGGLDRNHSFEPLTPYMDRVKYIVCYGQTSQRIEEYAKSINKKCLKVETLKEAVRMAYQFSEPKDVILLSPACASWDQYKDFEVRGTEFKKLIEEIKEEENE